jgi:hypothetical protein
MNRRRLLRTARAGFTVLELLVGATILLLLVGSLAEALTSLRRGATYATIDGDLQTEGQRAMRLVISSLKPSGFTTLALNPYPYLFQDGNAQGAYSGSAHAPAVHHAVVGDPDFGPNQEIVFLQPADADGDNRPDVDAGGNLVWSGSQHSFVVVTRSDGINVLQHRIDGGNPRHIAAHVERICFDDNATSGFQVPLRAVRIRIWFRQVDERGAVHRSFNEAVVKLRNE